VYPPDLVISHNQTALPNDQTPPRSKLPIKRVCGKARLKPINTAKAFFEATDNALKGVSSQRLRDLCMDAFVEAYCEEKKSLYDVRVGDDPNAAFIPAIVVRHTHNRFNVLAVGASSSDYIVELTEVIKKTDVWGDNNRIYM
jgi:hypothetical protein